MVAPFPYFGGKLPVADVVWSALGQPRHYIEPFFGSGAVLLARPNYDRTKHVETVNDKDGFLANVWRALQFAPDEVARWCDWPVNHADLNARRNVLRKKEKYLLENLIEDEKWYNAELAGYWIWAASCWIGGGLTRKDSIPYIGKTGGGVHKIGKRPNIGNTGIGVHKICQRPDINNAVRRVDDPYNGNIYTWFRELSERLRYVRVVCGDWTRVCGGNWQDNMGTVGIFFDPPYAVKDRDQSIYHHDDSDIAHDVREWCIDRGKNKSYRIVLAGYDEHEELIKHGWKKHTWKAQGGYSKLGKGKTRGNVNRKREALWFSPHCVNNDNSVFEN